MASLWYFSSHVIMFQNSSGSSIHEVELVKLRIHHALDKKMIRLQKFATDHLRDPVSLCKKSYPGRHKKFKFGHGNEHWGEIIQPDQYDPNQPIKQRIKSRSVLVN